MESSGQQSASFELRAKPLELELLSKLLGSPQLTEEIGESLSESIFVDKRAKEVFQYIEKTLKNGGEVSETLALSHFATSRTIEPYIMDVLSVYGATTPANLVESLREISARKRLFELLREGMHGVMGENDDVFSIGSSINRNLTSIIEQGEGKAKTQASFAEIGEQWAKEFKEGVQGGSEHDLKTGFDDLDDKIVRMEAGDLIVLGARPSMGKTTFAMNIVTKLSVRENKPTLVFSLEMPKEKLFERAVSDLSGVDYQRIRTKKLLKGDAEKISAALKVLMAAPIIVEDEPGLSIEKITARANKAKRDHDIKFIMADYLQLIKLPPSLANNRNVGVSEISRGLKEIAKNLKVPFMALSQLSRDLERRPNKRPVNSDLRDSGSIEQDADLIVFIYRDEVYNPDSPDKGTAEIIIGKQRNGPIDTVRLAFKGGQSRFESIEQNNDSLSTVGSNKKQAEYETKLESFVSRGLFADNVDNENPL